MSIIAQSYFHDERAALVELERLVWPRGPVCPHCGAVDRIGSVVGKGARLGLKFCCRCRKQFRATLGTMFEGSHVPLHKWFQACFLMAASDDRISAHQMHLRLEVTNKTALCMARRLRAALRADAADANPAEPGHDDALRPRPRWKNRSGSRNLAHLGTRNGEAGVDVEALPWVKPPLGAPRQFIGFVQVARALGCDEDQGRFAGALRRVVAQPGRTAARLTEAERPPQPPARETGLWPLPQISFMQLPGETQPPSAHKLK
jgi:hypothetical protein